MLAKANWSEANEQTMEQTKEQTMEQTKEQTMEQTKERTHLLNLYSRPIWCESVN